MGLLEPKRRRFNVGWECYRPRRPGRLKPKIKCRPGPTMVRAGARGLMNPTHNIFVHGVSKQHASERCWLRQQRESDSVESFRSSGSEDRR